MTGVAFHRAAVIESLEQRLLLSGVWFDAPGVYPAGGNPSSIEVADLDHDGDIDLVTDSEGDDQIRYVSVFTNRGDGTYAPGDVYPVGTDAGLDGIADVTGDGHADLLVHGWQKRWVLRGRGDGTFEPAERVPSASGVFGFQDLDADGDLDWFGVSPEGIAVRLDQGDGVFSDPATYPGGPGPSYPWAGDIDGDRDIDLVFSNAQFQSSIAILRNNGDGTFAPRVDRPAGGGIACMTDIDGDLDLDLLNLEDRGTDYRLTVRLNRGDGTFLDGPVSSAPRWTWKLVVLDVDGDGDRDLVCDRATELLDGIAVLRNKGSAAFDSPEVYTTEGRVRALAWADVDADADPDLLVASDGNWIENVRVLRNHGDGTFAAAVTCAIPPSGPHGIVSADLDSDGDLDLATANHYDQSVSVMLNGGDDTWAPARRYWMGVYSNQLFAADFDRDGDIDLLQGNYGRAESMLFNGGDGVFTVTRFYPIPVDAVADVDGDGDSDVMGLVSEGGPTRALKISLNRGDGVFSSGESYPVGFGAKEGMPADIDGDGDPDLIVLDQSGFLALLRNDGRGVFSGRTDVPLPATPLSVAAADLDDDGDLDLVAATQDPDYAITGTLTVLLNEGNGIFAPRVDYPILRYARNVCMLDLDGDGDLDVAALDALVGGIAAFLNNGAGALAAGPILGCGGLVDSLLAADLDSDGDVDLATAGTVLSVLKNRAGEYEIPGTPEADVFVLRLNAESGVLEVWRNADSTPFRTFAPGAVPKLVILGRGGNDQLTIDYAHGDPTPAAGVIFTGGLGTDTLHLLGTEASERWIGAGSRLGGPDRWFDFDGVEQVFISGGGGDDALEITSEMALSPELAPGDGLSTITLRDGTYLAPLHGGPDAPVALELRNEAIARLRSFPDLVRLDMSGNSRVELVPGGSHVLRLGELNVAENAVLDVTDNRIVNQASAQSAPEALAQLAELIRRGRLISSLAAEGLGMALAAVRNDVASMARPLTRVGSFAVNANSVLVMLAPLGDANLDGQINGDDYFRIDSAYLAQGPSARGWASGDFNQDARIDIDDYFLIDRAYALQSGPLAAQSAPAVVPAPVPMTPATAPNLFGQVPIGTEDAVDLDLEPAEVF